MRSPWASVHFSEKLKMKKKKRKPYNNMLDRELTKNLKILAATGVSINIRIPLIKGVNDDDKNIHESAKFIAALKGKKPLVNVLPFHNIAEKKYEKLSQHYDRGIMGEPDLARQNEVIEIFKSYGLNAIIGG